MYMQKLQTLRKCKLRIRSAMIKLVTPDAYCECFIPGRIDLFNRPGATFN